MTVESTPPMKKTKTVFWIAVSVLVGLLLAIGGYLLLGWIGPKSERHWPWTSLSALAAAPPLLLTWYWRTIHKQKELDTAEQGLLTERFIRAIELLGSDRLQIRLGGIYALERIAQDSERDHWTVMETLCAFARERTQAPRLAPGSQESPAGEENEHAKPTFLPPETDVQAALTVIGRRSKERRKWEKKENKRLDARGAHLEKADFARAHWEGADLRGTHLEGAILQGAHLEGTDLWGAHLEGTDLRRAHLEGANLWLAHLEGADLRFTEGLTQERIDLAIIDEDTRLPQGVTRPA